MANPDKGSDKGPAQSTPESPHDKLVKRVFGRPEHAASHLRTILPSKLAERVAWDTLKLEPGSYVGSNMRYLHTDSLFSTKLNDGSDRLVLFYLFEHQSTPDQLMAARLYGYTGQAVLSWLRRQTPTPKRIPAVLSLVLYDGKPTWTPPMDLIELFDLPEELREVCRPYLPSFRYILHDLWREQDADLRARPLSALILLTLLCLKHARSSQDLAALLTEWRDLFPLVYAEPSGRETLQFLMHYLLVVNKHVTTEDLKRGLAPAFGDKFQQVEETIMSTGQQLIEKGLKKGLKKGRQQGVQEGRHQERREVVQRLLSHKFGPLPEAVSAKLQTATAAQLALWLDRLLTVNSLDEVFE